LLETMRFVLFNNKVGLCNEMKIWLAEQQTLQNPFSMDSSDDFIMRQLNDSESYSYEVSRSLELLCILNGWYWAKNLIQSQLMALLNSCSANKCLGKIVRCVGHLSLKCPCDDSDIVSEVMTELLTILKEIIRRDQDIDNIQVIVENILHLYSYNLDVTLQALEIWTPDTHQNTSPRLKELYGTVKKKVRNNLLTAL